MNETILATFFESDVVWVNLILSGLEDVVQSLFYHYHYHIFPSSKTLIIFKKEKKLME